MLVDLGVGVVLYVCQFGGGNVHFLGPEEGDVLLGVTVNGGIVDDINPGIDNLGKLSLEESPGTTV